jgi:hypothetical protein
MRLSLPFLCALGACSYDWTVAPQSPDASSGTEAGIDVVVDSGTVVDSGADVPIDADGDVSAQPTCSSLVGANDLARAAAIECQPQVGYCKATTYRDECGCKFIAGNPNSLAAQDYKTSIDRLIDSGCQVPCPPTCGTGLTDRCLATDGGKFACAQ